MIAGYARSSGRQSIVFWDAGKRRVREHPVRQHRLHRERWVARSIIFWDANGAASSASRSLGSQEYHLLGRQRGSTACIKVVG